MQLVTDEVINIAEKMSRLDDKWHQLLQKLKLILHETDSMDQSSGI